MLSRRKLLAAASGLLGSAWLGPAVPAWADDKRSGMRAEPGVLSGNNFNLSISHLRHSVDGRRGNAVAINGMVPGPLLRWREGAEIVLQVTNQLAEDTSIHWHGILLPFQMDGVPGVTFPGIKPGQTFTYRFKVKQAGTYWYHSHSGFQEQLGHYGPIIIEPKDNDPVAYDREYVLLLADWTFQSPQRLFARLKRMSESLNFQKRTFGDFLDDVSNNGWQETLEADSMWGAMRMMPTDISDIGGESYSYLINGHGPHDNWTALFKPGERIRLRFINASAMTIFNLRIPGLPMTVVQADGIDVNPVETDEFQIGTAETYDVIVDPQMDEAFTIMAESIDRSGFARATLAPRFGMTAPIPPLRPPPRLTMKDMGHAPDHAQSHDAMPTHNAMDIGSMGHSKHTMAMPASQPQSHDHPSGPGVAHLNMNPTNRLNEPGIGLEDVPHRTLTYAQLKSLRPNPDLRPPEREIELHLTGNMDRYMWSFDGVQFSEVKDSIIFHEGERVRLTLVNDTMMSHPIHLHGMYFDVVNGAGTHKPRKHTITIKPGEQLSLDVTADALGDWAFHCHLLYHMHAGMFRIVSVKPRTGITHT